MTARGRTIAITGAARGIGLATARRLHAAGARVAIGDLDGELARSEADRLGNGALGLELDVTDTGSFERFLDAAQAALGPLDVLINNAGIMWVGRFEDEPERAALKQMEVNFHGVARGIRLAVPRMRARGRGHIITVASAASKVAPPGEATYAATKHAVLGYCTAVREELRGSGIELTLIMPVVVETELAAGTSHGRGARLTPDAVAEAIEGAVRRPRFEVFVPGNVALLARLKEVLPQRGRDALVRALVPDQVRATDERARAGYQGRTLS